LPVSTDEPLDEDVELRAIQQDARLVTKFVNSLTRLKPGSPDVLDRLDKVMRSLPRPEALSETIQSIWRRAERLASDGRRLRLERFGRIEAEFIRDVKRSGSTFRELDDAWRVDELELRLRRGQAQVEVRYNREILIPWTSVGATRHLDDLVARAKAKLTEGALDERALIDCFWRAYKARAGSKTRLPLPDFFRSVQDLLVEDRRESGADAKPRLPKWAFLHNLDHYRKVGSTIPQDRRLTVETGSQLESSRIGMVLGGLDVGQDYKVYCYVAGTLP
jgi:hypothetical protein